MSDLDYCRFRQSEAGAYIRANGPDSEGAKRGVEDWLMEEAIILAREKE